MPQGKSPALDKEELEKLIYESEPNPRRYLPGDPPVRFGKWQQIVSNPACTDVPVVISELKRAVRKVENAHLLEDPPARQKSAMGRGQAAEILLSEAAELGIRTTTRKKEIARKPRDRDALGRLIRLTCCSIHASGREISTKVVLHELHTQDAGTLAQRPGAGLSPSTRNQFHDQHFIYWQDEAGRQKKTEMKLFRDRVSSRRKQILRDSKIRVNALSRPG